MSLSVVKQPLIDEGVLTADIVQAVRDSNPPESIVSEGTIFCAYFILGNGVLRWFAYPVK